ncbi:MAG: YlxR family protein [Mariprofundaceae bacterium]
MRLVVGLNEMSADRTVVRSCFCCRGKIEKSLMLRLVVDDEGAIWPDLLQKAPGRGIYLCMQSECFSRLNDKRLVALKSKYKVYLPQLRDLTQRLQDVLYKQVCLQFRQLQSSAAIGRDAVMHQMWKNEAQLLLLAKEAGQALSRQVMNAVVKRDEQGLKTIPLKGISEQFLSDVFQREKVSVVSIGSSKRTKKLQRYCAWYEQIKGSKVSNGE